MRTQRLILSPQVFLKTNSRPISHYKLSISSKFLKDLCNGLPRAKMLLFKRVLLKFIIQQHGISHLLDRSQDRSITTSLVNIKQYG